MKDVFVKLRKKRATTLGSSLNNKFYTFFASRTMLISSGAMISSLA